MTQTTMRPDGVPWWAELATPDLDRACAFYTAVLGWTLTDDGDGLLARRRDREGDHDVARLRTAPDGAALWTVYFAVDDADDACERLVELGGSLLHDPEDGADGAGGARVFLALDPGGAEFGGREADDAPPERGHGVLVGADAASAEPGQARTFYERLFGYRYEGATIVHPAVGPLGTLDIAGDALPHWRLRFGVADLGRARDAVAAAGGCVLAATEGTAVVDDGSGAPIVLTEVPP